MFPKSICGSVGLHLFELLISLDLNEKLLCCLFYRFLSQSREASQKVQVCPCGLHPNQCAHFILLFLETESLTKKGVSFFDYVQFVSSPGCQYILNEIIYQDPRWQDRNIAVKMLWAVFVQLLLVVVLSTVYVPYKLMRVCMKKTYCKKSNSMSSCGCNNDFFSFVKDVFEHPYSKFINHTTWYLVFLILVIVSTFKRNFGTTSTGFSILGKRNRQIRLTHCCTQFKPSGIRSAFDYNISV